MAPPRGLVTALLGWVPSLSSNLRRPAGVVGWLLGKFLFPTVNAGMVRLAVDRLRLHPGERVLEVGFGPGVGLAAALEALAHSPASSPTVSPGGVGGGGGGGGGGGAPLAVPLDGGGGRPSVVGLDFSDAMVSMASTTLRLPIAEGRLRLVAGDVCAPDGVVAALAPAPVAATAAAAAAATVAPPPPPTTTTTTAAGPPRRELSAADAFDAAFHVNCYYFWADKAGACRNIWAALRPGGRLLTVYDRALDARGPAIFSADIVFALDAYTEGLTAAGFVNIHTEEVVLGEQTLAVVTAYKAG